MKFLFKFPSRGRPEIFKNCLIQHIKYLSNENEYKFVFSFDEDDPTMNNEDIVNFINLLNIENEIHYGHNQNKIEAINANLDSRIDFDILMLIADDILPITQNYDKIIEDIINTSNLGLDCTIHFNNSRWSNILDIFCIMGKIYYERFNYIYNPEYKSIFCDNEYTEVSKLLGKNIFSDKTPFIHNNKTGDDTEIRNWRYNHEDWLLYQKRKESNFNLK